MVDYDGIKIAADEIIMYGNNNYIYLMFAFCNGFKIFQNGQSYTNYHRCYFSK